MSRIFRRHLHPDDLDTDDEQDAAIDDDLRLHTVRTAASTIAESIRSEQRAERRKRKSRKSRFFGRSEKRAPSVHSNPPRGTEPESQQQASISSKPRRNIYINTPLPSHELAPNGEPWVRYVRNKVRTSKYTIITFIPKNLYEQFRRIANLYFLALVCIQVFPVFGAAAPQLAMVPLAFILSVTAIKDGIEDYRRAKLDDEVNTSAATKLGQWRNVNQPSDPRTWFQRALGLNKPGSVSKGVRKLREREQDDFRIVLQRTQSLTTAATSDSGVEEIARARLADIPSISSSSSHTYPPDGPNRPDPTSVDIGLRDRSSSLASSSYPASNSSRVSAGVVDWNRQPTSGTARWERTLWKKLEVGDIVLLRDNDQVPADIVVLATSDSDGMCYVETKNLDGETNLKPRHSLRATSSIVSEEDIEHASFVVDSEPPHANLYLYNGVLRFNDSDGVERVEPITINELLLRGCAIRNTSWIIGLVVFTGADTKIMLNGGDTPSKRSKIEKETNFNVIMNFIVLLLMCITTAIVNGYYDVKQGTSARFFEQDSDPSSSVVLNSLVTFCSCLIAFQNIVPISLYISIEIVKTIQAYFISQDVDMYYRPLNTACVPKTWNISDDLGQIEYIFSDKTGTLTQNVMEFQKCSVNGIPYGEGVTEAQRGALRREGKGNVVDPVEDAEKIASLKEDMIQRMNRAFKNRYLRSDRLTLISPTLANDLSDRSSQQRGHLISFFRALAICHTVLPDRADPKNPFALDYKAESPDEAALVAAARDVGFPFVQRSNGAIDIEIMGQIERHTPLKVLEFNSTRKRMSVIVRNPEGKVVVYCKGADSVIYARLSKHQDEGIKAATQKNMEDFANGGLRTLCIAYKYLTDEEYIDWVRTFDAASAAIKDRDEEMEKANELVEKDLFILGATALEDKLQEGVPDAIETLHNAGIKLWILTGDKLQTAIEIGFSCNLLKPDMEIMILSADTAEATRAHIEAGLNKISSMLGPPPVNKDKNRGFIPGAQKAFAVVIDGDTLRYALEPDLKPLFLTLGTQCETVVCCRVSPAQKALTVKLVKEGRNAMTLSIGDGANDVAMIQEANIGCGLFGLEGSQAAMSADYAFGQFRFLTKLLLVHGRWSYLRIADMHSNFFYKNVIWTLAMFWYLFYNSFDATYLYEYTFILLYNLVFTSLPVICLGAFDQDVNARASLAFPQLYLSGIRGLEYTRWKFWTYMLDGLYQSAIVFYIPYLIWALGNVSASYNGRSLESLADFGTTVSVAAIFSANIFVGLNTNYWSTVTWVTVIGSNLVMLIWIGVYSLFTTPTFTDEFILLLGTVNFWGAVLISVALAVGPRFIIRFVSKAYYPTDRDIVREMWVLGDLKDRLGIKHRREKRNRKDVEHTPIFQSEYHERSISEINSLDLPYDAPPRTYIPTDDPPKPSNSDLSKSPTLLDTNLDPSKSTALLGMNSTYVINNEWDTETPIAPNPPREMQLSRVSYYSVSDLPPPSPLPEANVYSPRASRAVSAAITMSSVATNPVSQEHRVTSSLFPPPHRSGGSPRTTPPQSPSYHQLISPRTARSQTDQSSYSGNYEMRVRSPPRSPQLDYRAPSPVSHITEQSESSFVTAEEGSRSGPHSRTGSPQLYDEDAATIREQPVGGAENHDPWRDSVYSQSSGYTVSGPHAL
ncbi:phospholipid-transporting ATPase 1 [Hysterangium stoloniferum]|nr:phospholipid-transporting ATPase 1 [Hysterangium stoloniferum]